TAPGWPPLPRNRELRVRAVGSGAVGKESAVRRGTQMTDGQPPSVRGRVRGQGEPRGRAAGRLLAGRRSPCAPGRARPVRATRAPVRERGTCAAGGDGGAGAHDDVHGPAGAIVDRRTARASAVQRPVVERDAGGGGGAVSRSGSRARWQGELRSSSCPTGSP